MTKLVTNNWLVSLILFAMLTFFDNRFHFSKPLSMISYDVFATLYAKYNEPVPEIKDFVIVGIDSETIRQMDEKWPYSRKTFARVLEHLKQAGAKAIGLDFSFFGNSVAKEEDEALKNSIVGGKKVVLGAALTEQGGIQFSNVSDFPISDISGLVNKLQDSDGDTRDALTYLISKNEKAARRSFFSWELKILEAAGDWDLTTMKDEGGRLTFKSKKGPITIPVDPVTKTFPIRFEAHTGDFKRLSFYQVLEGNFDPDLVNGKMVLIGFLSEMFHDLHKTPIGWLPGVTLNANALLTLYAQNFLRPLPQVIPITITILVLLLNASLLTELTSGRLFGLLVLTEIACFCVLSYFLLVNGFTWNYARFPVLIAVISIVTRKLTTSIK